MLNNYEHFDFFIVTCNNLNPPLEESLLFKDFTNAKRCLLELVEDELKLDRKAKVESWSWKTLGSYNVTIHHTDGRRSNYSVLPHSLTFFDNDYASR